MKANKLFTITLIIITILSFALLTSLKVDNNSWGIRYTPLFKTESDSIKRIRVICAGDAMAHLPQITAALNHKSGFYDFSSSFVHLKPMLSTFDLRIVNYETTCGGEPFTGYPQFSAPDTLAWAVKDAGFNLFVNANNHSADRGKDGIIKTIQIFEKYNINHTGTFLDKAQRDTVYPYLWEKDSVRIAILNCTYGTNGLAVPKPVLVNMIDTAELSKDIDKAKSDSIDLIAVAIHWGQEYVREPGKDQKLIAEFLISKGVDIIIGSHPHVVQPIEIVNTTYKGKNKNVLVVWSLGNLISNQQRQYTDGGILVNFDIEKHLYNDSIAITNIGYAPVWVYRSEGSKSYQILPVYSFLNDDSTVVLSEEKKTLFKRFAKETREHLQYRDSIRIREYIPQNN